jgi:TolB-like protein/Tfp pilus assembly protein PilF
VPLRSTIVAFYAELRKRRVLKATIAYIVMCWILIEGSALIFPALLFPDWSHRIVVVLAIIGFPIVIVLAWIFDITPSGVERTEPAAVEADAQSESTGSPSKQTDVAAPPPVESALASIAVLPFDALSVEADDIYLARSISAEISSALSHLPEIRVAPSRSTSALDNKSDLQKIGVQLDVQYVLTGSVRCSGDSIRVLAELSDAQKGSVLWSEAYDRKSDHLMAVEVEIATAIVGSFGGEHLREQIRSARDHATDSLEARSLVHRARAYILNFNKDSLAEAETFARQAIDIDPGYASAHAALASVLSEKVNSGLADNAESDLAEALLAINTAVKLSPQDPLVLKLAGSVWSHTGQHEKAESILRRAIEIAPFDFGAWGYLASVLATSGSGEDSQDARAILDRIIKMAPQHPGQAFWLHHKALACTTERRYKNAVRYAKQAIDRQPGLAWAWYLYANALAMTGDLDAAINAAARAIESNPELSVSEYAAIVERTSGSESVRESRVAGLEAIDLLKPA